MKEIKIVLNNDEKTCPSKPFSVFIDGNEIRNIDKFTLVAKSFSAEELSENNFLDFDNVIKYTVEQYAPYFED